MAVLAGLAVYCYLRCRPQPQQQEAQRQEAQPHADVPQREAEWSNPLAASSAAPSDKGNRVRSNTAQQVRAAPARPKSPARSRSHTEQPDPTWRQFVDPKSGKPYYVNRQTRETTWTPPPGFDGGEGSDLLDRWGAMREGRAAQLATSRPRSPSRPSARPTGSSSDSRFNTEPPVFAARIDPATGRQYYVNCLTRESVWVLPPDGRLDS
jgi:hypothetical protein